MEKIKSIGIITYHKAYNYGSALQSFALNKYLRSQGYKVETINFQTKRQNEMYSTFEPVNSIMSFIRNGQSLFALKKLNIKKERFDDFLRKNIPLSKDIFYTSEELKHNLNYDYYICGSDQVWNPNCTDFDEAYLLSFVEDKSKCISYAPSIAVSSISKEYELLFRKNLSGFKSISIREESGADIIERIIGIRPKVMFDPVFLLSDNEWIKNIGEREINTPYIFAYFVGDVSGMRDFAKKMRKQLNIPLVVVYKNLRDVLYPNKKMYDAGPKEFLSLLYHADYIITNSFHAVTFSTIFKKKFWAFVDDDSKLSAKSRIYNIAKKLYLDNRILSASNCNVKIDEMIDYEKCNTQIKQEQDKAFEYLSKALGK